MDLTLLSIISSVIVAINQSVGAGATVNSTALRGEVLKKVKVWWKTKGTNTTGKLQGSFDNTTWYDIQTLAAGINAVQDIVEPYIRISVSNAGAGAESNEVQICVQK